MWAGVEVALAATAVLLDLFLPTLALLVLAGVSLGVRREHWSSLGFHRLPAGWRTVGLVLGLAVAWTGVQLALIMPLAEHLTGERQDVSAFAEVEGDLPLLLILLAVTWTLAAVGEETAYRGYLLTRVTEVLGSGRAATVAAVLASSVLFGLAHTEQGLVGVVLTTVDALFFSWLRFRLGTLWAPVLAHGFNNTIGLVAYFFVGPIYALW